MYQLVQSIVKILTRYVFGVVITLWRLREKIVRTTSNCQRLLKFIVCCCKELFMIHQPSVNGPTIPQWGWSWLIRMLDGITAMGLQKHYHDLQEGNAATEMQGNALLT